MQKCEELKHSMKCIKMEVCLLSAFIFLHVEKQEWLTEYGRVDENGEYSLGFYG